MGDDGAFSMNMVELDMGEAESLAWKQEKDDKVREMKVQQLKEQIKLEAEIAAREYSMVQEVIFNPLLIEVLLSLELYRLLVPWFGKVWNTGTKAITLILNKKFRLWSGLLLKLFNQKKKNKLLPNFYTSSS